MFFIAIPPLRGFAEDKPDVYFVTVTMNKIQQTGVFSALKIGEEFFLDTQSFAALGLITPDAPPRRYRGTLFFSLTAYPNLNYSFDANKLGLNMTCSPSCFPGSGSVLRGWQYNPPDPTPLGMFMNYDLVAEKNVSSEFLGGLAELGFFSNYGFGRMAFSGRNLTGDAELIRLDTNLTIDDPQRGVRYRLGDSITAARGWRQAVRFAGVQFGTDFTLNPGFVTFPTPSINGEAALPSTADIYVNGVRRSSIDVLPGPFTLEQPPVITGSGEIKVVVRDLLGRETILIQPFYASQNLLKTDISEYSLETGWLRKNFGTRSSDYDEFFVAGNLRRGFTDKLTVGFHAETSTERAGIGPTIGWQTPLGGTISLAAGMSLQNDEVGELLRLNFNWSSEKVGFQFFNEMVSTDFTRLGESDSYLPPRMRNSANLGFELASFGAISLNYTHSDERDREDFEVIGVNYSVQLGNIGSFGINVSRAFGETANTVLLMNFTTRLAERTTASTSIEHRGGKWKGSLRASKNPPYDGGFGYSVEVRPGGDGSERANLTFDSTKGTASLDLNHSRGETASRLGLRGGAVLVDGDIYLSNPVKDSFALVKAGDYEGIGVLRDNRRIVRTNSKGRALITGLRAYENNLISIDPLDLPLSAEIKGTTLSLVPRRHSGVIADFPVRHYMATLITIVDEEGRPMRPGSVMHSKDGSADITIAFRGKAYVPELEQAQNFYVHTMDGGICTVIVPPVELLPSSTPIPSTTITCKGAHP